jgi:C4-dicarboxylate transporter DctQ subunit
MAWLDRILSRFEEVATTAFISVAVVVTFVEVIYRYVFGGSLGWANEVTIIAVIWATLIGASLGVREGIHIGVDVVVERLPWALARVATMVALMASAAWVFAVGIWGVEFVRFQMRTNRLTPELEIPAWTTYAVVPLSMFMMTFRFVQAAVRHWRTPPSAPKKRAPVIASPAKEATHVQY